MFAQLLKILHKIKHCEVNIKKGTYFDGVLSERLAIRKFNIELDIKIALLVRITIDRHAFFGNRANSAWSENLASRLCEYERATVQLLDDHLEAAQRLGDVDGVCHEEVVVVAAEHVVLLQLQYYD